MLELLRPLESLPPTGEREQEMAVMTGFRGQFARWLLMAVAGCLSGVGQSYAAEGTGIVKEVEWQPLAAQVERVIEAMDYMGSALAPEIKSTFEKLRAGNGSNSPSEEIQKVLDPLCLYLVE